MLRKKAFLLLQNSKCHKKITPFVTQIKRFGAFQFHVLKMAWIWSLFSSYLLIKNPPNNWKNCPTQIAIPFLTYIRDFKPFSEVIIASSNPLILSNSWNLAAQSGVKNNLVFISTLNMLKVGFSVNRWHQILFFFNLCSFQDSCTTYKWQSTNIEDWSIFVLLQTVLETWRHAFGIFVPVSEYHDSLFRIWLYLKLKINKETFSYFFFLPHKLCRSHRPKLELYNLFLGLIGGTEEFSCLQV